MRPTLSLILGGVLAWQAVAAAVGLASQTIADAAVDYRLRLLADTGTRIRSALGADAPIYLALREQVPEGGMVLTRKLQGSMAELDRLAARQGTIQQLTNLLYPDPVLLRVPDPVGLIEQRAEAGKEPWLLLLPGDPEPAGKAGWSCRVRTERFQLWQFQKV